MKRTLLNVLVALSLGPLMAQPTVERTTGGPTNIDCEHAQTICDDTIFPFENVPFSGCLWFSFTLAETTDVDLIVSANSGKFALVGPYGPTDPCNPVPPSACTAVVGDVLTIDQILPAGTYFITVSFSDGIGNDIRFEVARAFDCAPLNTDCANAMDFCDDISQSFSPAWAAAEPGCLWYSFELTEQTLVGLLITSAGSKIRFYQAEHCPTCGQRPTLEAANSMALGSVLDPGIYFISVSVDANTPGPVNIDVVRGLHCAPSNTDCSTAIPFCEDLVQSFSPSWAAANAGCLWYSFELEEPTVVDIIVNCPGSKVRFYNNVPCPSCEQRPDAEDGPSLQIQGLLQPGIYYFAVPVNATTPGPVTIDVIGGLGCGDAPTNVDCRTAIPFCKDMIQSFDEGWTPGGPAGGTPTPTVPVTGCLWYRFDLTEPTPVNLIVSSAGSTISFYADEDCPNCGQVADLSSTSTLHLQSTLPAGAYFISVTVTTSTPGPITINVISGLSCDGPENVDCGSALTLCEDIVQLYTAAWAVADPGCLWYTFEVIEETAVNINIVSPGATIKFYEDLLCPLCTDAPAAQSTNEMTVLSSLVPGTYFISVSTGPSTSGSVMIDLISGVSCELAPQNLGCGTAIPFCTDLTQTFSPTWAAANPSCLWYSFELTEPTPVSMAISSAGSTIRVFSNAVCPNCTDEPGMEATNTLELASGLLPGTYFIAVSVDQNTPGPVTINVLSGLDCDNGPTNIDCASALLLCADLTQSFTPAWAAAMPGCLWYSFAITETGPVNLTVTSEGSHIRLFSEAACPNCADMPSAEAVNEFDLNASLVPGTYFIAVTVDSNTPGPVLVDIISGLDCDDDEPTNQDCNTALTFCDDLVQSYSSSWALADQGCLWYSFELTTATGVELSVSSTGSTIQLYGPVPPQSECPACGVQPAQSGVDLLTIQTSLQPGTYFISASVIQVQGGPPLAASGTVSINVISGLSCNGTDPTNVDCGQAIPFCGDVEQPFSTTWALQNEGCLWYSFDLEQQTNVHFTTSSPGSQINLYGPFSSEDACPACGELPIQSAQNSMTVQTSLSTGVYFVSVSIAPPTATPTYGPVVIDVISGLACLPCVDCIPPLELVEDSRYIITAWAHVPDVPGNALTLTQPLIKVESPIGTVISSFGTSGVIIDGWQRMEGTFATPSGYTSLRISFTSNDGPVYYDDVRLLPEKGSMKSYVYDPVDLRFVAELDERHYATFYEYDAEGKLARVKKETERGVMTIQETRNNSSKVNQP
jgi:hypothetical protein